MNRDDIIRMAREAGLIKDTLIIDYAEISDLEIFAALVAAAEREAIKWNSLHSCHADCQSPACMIVREAVAAEREACAKVCEKSEHNGGIEDCGAKVAAAIRARGQE